MAIGDPKAVAQWQSLTAPRTVSQSSEMGVTEHFQQLITILSTLEDQFKEKYEEAKSFYEDDGEEQSLGEMKAYNDIQKVIGNLKYQVGRDLRSREAAMNNYGFTYMPQGHIGFP